MTIYIRIKQWSALALLSAVTLLNGCKDPEYPTPSPSTSQALNSRILAVNASPDAPAINILVNNVQVGSSLGYLQAFSGYANAAAGPAQLKGKAASGSIGGTLGTNDILFRAGATNQNNFSFTGNTNYTVFITDTLAKPRPNVPGGSNPGGPQFLIVQDNLAVPPADSAKVRFFHLAPGAPAVWVNVVGGSTLFANRAYRAVSTGSGATAVNFANFTNVKSGLYTLEVRTGSASGPVALLVPTVNLEAGKIYTIYARGLLNGTGEKALGASIIQHN
jgi:hypothetical protein